MFRTRKLHRQRIQSKLHADNDETNNKMRRMPLHTCNPDGNRSWSLRKNLGSLSFHGFKYITEGNPVIRSCWCVCLLITGICAVWVFLELFARYRTSPTITSIVKQQDFVDNFPNVILCPETDFSQEKIDMFMNTFRMPPNVSKEIIKSNLRQLAAFMDPDVEYDVQTLVILESILEYNSLTLQQGIVLLLPSCKEIILRCRWKGEPWECSVLFTEILTGDGFCCSFNGKSIYDSFELDPLRIFAGGPNSGLMFLILHNESPTSVDLGYKWLVIQEQERFYEIKNNGTPINPGYEYLFGHHTLRLVSSTTVMELEKSLRNCVEQSESTLKLFPIYDRAYCKAECELESSLKLCGCILHTSPARFDASFCGANELPCAQRAVAMASCDCPESCEQSRSQLSTNMLRLVAPTHVIDTDFYHGLNPEKMSIVRVYGADTRSEVVSRRENLFDFFNLISQLGGVFGVYLGCSFISGVEIIFLAWKILRQIFTRQSTNRAGRRRVQK